MRITTFKGNLNDIFENPDDRANYRPLGLVQATFSDGSTDEGISTLENKARSLGATHVFGVDFRLIKDKGDGFYAYAVVFGDAYKQELK